MENSQERLHNVEIDFPIETVEVFLEILVAMFEDERQFFITVEHVVKTHNVFVFQLFEEANFSKSR